MKRYSEIDFDNLTTEEFKQLPDDYQLAWFRRPKYDKLESAKKFMYFRATLIGLTFLYLIYTNQYELYKTAIMVIIFYEGAYYLATEARLNAELYREMDKHEAMVAELDRKYAA